MARTRTSYVCRTCGAVEVRWMGKCPSCGAWDALEAVRAETSATRDRQRGHAEGWRAAGDDDGNGRPAGAVRIEEAGPEAGAARLRTGIGELDRVLGGGFVPGSVVLLGGDPGIGKSTLLLQAMGGLTGRLAGASAGGARTLYVTSEESAEQVRLRAERLGVLATWPPGGDDPSGPADLFVLADTNLARILEQARRVEPAVLVLDSIQMVYAADAEAAPGSVTQLRRCCTDLVFLAKASGIAIVLVGHVTKEGTLAGPRLLEHLVDVVLSFEGDRYHAHRIVRSIKNRFGTTLELGLFEMGQQGLVEVPDGASVAAASLGDEARPGSVVAPLMMGSRCVLVEIQALTATGFPGAVRRRASGLDANRLAMLIAVLEQRAGQQLHDREVFASAVGGVRVSEPAGDLALALAIAGAHMGRAMPLRTAAIGEVGLGGEVRPVTQMAQRLREATRLGYTTLLAPRGVPAGEVKGIDIVEVRSVGQAVELLR